MNADGSIQSTTVSEHVYSASGLSKVTDQSTLTNIQNTESSAEFTQDGEKLGRHGFAVVIANNENFPSKPVRVTFENK